MATSNNKRDVRLGVEIETAGEESLKRLADQVRLLAKAGDDAAPQYVELADSLERNVTVARELAVFKQASEAIASTSAAAEKATENAQRLRQEFQKQSEATDSLRSSQAAIRTQLDATNRSVNEQTQVLAQAKIALTANKDENGELAKAVVDAASSLAKFKREAADLGLDLKNSNREVKDSEASLRKLATESLNADQSARSLSTALRAQADAMERAQKAGAQLGADFTDVAAAQQRLDVSLRDGVAALVASAEAARQKVKADEQVALAARDAAAAIEVQSRAQQALDGIRKAAAAQNRAAELKAEAEAQRELTNETQRAERVEAALNNIRKLAAAQNRAAELKAEAEAQRELTVEQTRAERIEVALNNIRKLAAAQNRTVEIQAEAKATRDLAEAAERAGRALPDAFGAVGVRSLQTIQLEINQTARALRLLETQQQAGAISALDLARATGAAELKLQQLRAELSQMPAAVGVLERMNGQVMDLVTRFGALSVAITTVGFAVKPVYDATVQLESMQRVLTQVFGSADEAAKAIAFVSQVADNAGVSVKSVAGDFTKFAASAKSAGIETETIKEVFASVTGAVGNLGLGSEQASRILTALAQSASKGKIQMEELGQQLGDALPGALGLLAKGLGITQPELVKLIESGRLLTDQALKPLAAAMLELSAPSGRVESTAASFARLGNAVTQLYRDIGDSAAFKLIGKAAGALADNFNTVVTAVEALGTALLTNKIVSAVTNFVSLRTAVTTTAVATVEATAATVASTTATTANTVATTANTAAKVANAAAMTPLPSIAKAATEGLVGLNVGLRATAPAAEAAATGVGLAAQAMGVFSTAGRAVVGLFGGPLGLVAQVVVLGVTFRDEIGRAAAALTGFGDKSDKVKKQLQEAEEAANRNAEARVKEAESIVKLNVRYAEQANTLAKTTAANEKLADATKTRGEASVLAATLADNERDKLVATTVALEDEFTALGRVADGKAKEAKLTADLIVQVEKSLEGKGKLNEADQDRLDTLTATRDLLGNLTNAEKAEIAALEAKQKELKASTAATREQIDADKLKLQGQQASADAALAAADKLRALADASKLAAEASKDNSTRVEEFRVKMNLARESVAVMKQALDRGEVSQEAYNRSVIAAGAAEGLFKDALDDSIKALGRRRDALRDQATLQSQDIELKRKTADVQQALADITGAYTDKVQAAIDKKGLDVETSKQKIRVAEQEAALLREEADLKQRNLQLNDPLYAQKQREIDSIINAARVKANEGLIERENLRLLEVQFGALTGTLYKTAAGFGAVTAAARAAEEATLRYGSALQSTQYDKDKFALNSDGSRFTAGGQLQPPDSSGNWEFKGDVRANNLNGPPGAVGVMGQGWWVPKNGPAFSPGPIGGPASSNNGRGTPVLGTVNNGRGTPVLGTVNNGRGTPVLGTAGTTVNINLAGLGTTSVKVASPADATRLEALLRQIEDAAAREGGGP